MPVGSKSRLSLVDSECADIGGDHVNFKKSVKYLGVHFDQSLSMQQQINCLCRAAFLELRIIASTRPYLSQNGTAQLVSSMVTSRLDYSNSILAGLQAGQITLLQRIQYSTARFVTKRDHHNTVSQSTALTSCKIPLPV